MGGALPNHSDAQETWRAASCPQRALPPAQASMFSPGEHAAAHDADRDAEDVFKRHCSLLILASFSPFVIDRVVIPLATTAFSDAVASVFPPLSLGCQAVLSNVNLPQLPHAPAQVFAPPPGERKGAKL